MRLGASRKLRKASDFARLRAKGSRFNCGSFVLIAAERAAGTDSVPAFPRFAVIASKKMIGNRAVDRNRAKRVFREIFRLNQTAFPQNWDILIIAKRNALLCPFGSLTERFLAGARFLRDKAQKSA